MAYDRNEKAVERTMLSNIEELQESETRHRVRLERLDQWLRQLYNRVGYPYPGDEPTEMAER